MSFFLRCRTIPFPVHPTTFSLQKTINEKMQALNEEMSLKKCNVLLVSLSQSDEGKYFFGNRC